MITQIKLIATIVEAIGAERKIGLTARELNAVIRAATDIVRELQQPERPVIPGMGINAWLRSDHIGSSSLYMARVLAKVGAARYAYPHDPADLQRCIGLLIACPELRSRLDSMADTGPEWAAIIPHWAEWELLLEEIRTAPEYAHEALYERMRAVLNAHQSA